MNWRIAAPILFAVVCAGPVDADCWGDCWGLTLFDAVVVGVGAEVEMDTLVLGGNVGRELFWEERLADEDWAWWRR